MIEYTRGVNVTNEQQNETRAAAGEEPAQPAVKQESPAGAQESAPAKEATATEAEAPEEEAPQAEEAEAPAEEEPQAPDEEAPQAEEPETPAEEPQAEEPETPAEEPQTEEPQAPAEEAPQAEEAEPAAAEEPQAEEAEPPAEEPEPFAEEAPQAKAPAPEEAGESLPAGADKTAAPQEGFVFQALHAPLEAAGEKRADIRDGAQPAAGSRSERRAQPAAGSRGERRAQPTAGSRGERRAQPEPEPEAAGQGAWQQAELAGARRPHAQTQKPQRPARSEEAAQAKAAPRRKHRAACAVLAVAALLAAGGVGYSARLLQENLLAAAEPASVSVSVSVAEEAPEAPDLTATEADGSIGILRLANTQHPLPDGYVPPNLETMDGEGRQLDARAAQPLRDMIAAARADGCQLVLSSGYRSYERQEELFAMMIVDYLNLGYSYGDAYAATKNLRNIPGTSEHQTGLAADIVAADYWTMDDGYAETDEAKWLVEHAADYGFILRYPADKEHITGTHFEPWHYRYIGVEDAQKIMAAGVCLEEYLGAVE
ncbi:MAG TPA: D-alanyl-D-alanine carboxypeptidase family protein [Candidatus Ruthenibacterium merdigallinarum]|nr:D-alanyl-D-alanine carboxypeptidase family protein [Candidatus Ruthenibacterium merdigallinarum]